MMPTVPLTTGCGAEHAPTLWDRFRQEGDEASFLRLYDIYLHDLFHYGMSLCQDRDLVKDLVQELFLQLWERHLHLGTAPNVRAYLLGAFRTHLLQHLRRNRRFTRLRSALQLPKMAEGPALDLWLEEETQRRRRMNLALAMDQLPERQREAVHLRFYAGLTCDEIAQIMQTEVQSTYNLLHRGLQSLRGKLA
jgi:RNA polymerase sigma factor (sigma-70 family)